MNQDGTVNSSDMLSFAKLIGLMLLVLATVMFALPAKAVPVKLTASGDFDFYGIYNFSAATGTSDPGEPDIWFDYTDFTSYSLYSEFDLQRGVNSFYGNGTAFLTLTGNQFGFDGVFSTNNFYFSYDIVNDTQAGVEDYASYGGSFTDLFRTGATLNAAIDIFNLGFVNNGILDDGSTTSKDRNNENFGNIFDPTLDPNLVDQFAGTIPGRNKTASLSLDLKYPVKVDVPEPSTMMLMSMGLLGLIGFKKGKNNNA